jgi:hypothetical protein
VSTAVEKFEGKENEINPSNSIFGWWLKPLIDAGVACQDMSHFIE